ncbi:MAG: response regulator transcription factor [Anaerolineales bacterium]|nr:response regulator transcription factor [Anaerolineales bacterium]
MTNDSGIRVLIIDDEIAIRRFLRTSLQASGYMIIEAHTGEEGIAEIINKRPDLVILDIGLPVIDGIEVIKKIREWSDIPILILSVMDQEKKKIEALDAGADDYLTKPFSVGELMARMRVLMRRINPQVIEQGFESSDLRIDFNTRIVMVKNLEISLTPTEFDLLRILAQNAGKVMTHKQIISLLWGESYQGESHLLRVNISNLRKKIEPNFPRPTYIITEPGVGYRLKISD